MRVWKKLILSGSNTFVTIKGSLVQVRKQVIQCLQDNKFERLTIDEDNTLSRIALQSRAISCNSVRCGFKIVTLMSSALLKGAIALTKSKPTDGLLGRAQQSDFWQQSGDALADTAALALETSKLLFLGCESAIKIVSRVGNGIEEAGKIISQAGKGLESAVEQIRQQHVAQADVVAFNNARCAHCMASYTPSDRVGNSLNRSSSLAQDHIPYNPVISRTFSL